MARAISLMDLTMAMSAGSLAHHAQLAVKVDVNDRQHLQITERGKAAAEITKSNTHSGKRFILCIQDW
jgi:hypothetical protein